MKKQRIENNNFAKKESHLIRNLIITFLLILVVTTIVFFSVYFIRQYTSKKITVNSIKKQWNTYDYSGVYESGKQFLQIKPYNNTVLTYYGYACFYLAISQNDTFKAQEYMDEAINNIRLALYEAKPSLTPQLQYMLGKCYFYKNTISKYYYADLAVKYLNLAKENGYEADDISEYLGLSYASLGMTMESISAFTEALLVRESDSLLLSIAEQYYKAGQLNAAEQYGFRIINNCKNDEIILKTKLLLGQIYLDQENYTEAMNLYNQVLELNPNNADSHFGIGCIYEKQNNSVKARAEWRKTLKLQPNHAGAQKKLSN